MKALKEKAEIMEEAKVMAEQNVYREVIHAVYKALVARGYDPCFQLSGYLLTGDPTYITNANDARKKIASIDREELLRVLVKCYLDQL